VDSVTILRELWRRRLLVVVVGLLSVGAGWMLAYGPSFPPKPRSYQVGMATARVLVDTPRSQVVEVAPEGSDMLGARAGMLANLMVYGELEQQIEKRAGLKRDVLIAGSETTGGATAPKPLTRDSRALTTGVVVNSDLAELPLIKIETQAPTATEAAKLADAAVNGLIAYVDAKAAAERVTPERRLRVAGLGPAQAHLAARGTGKMMGLAVAIFVFLSGCSAIVAVSFMARAWRAAAARERQSGSHEAAIANLLDGAGNGHADAKTTSRA
jgi:hypothetical protein